MNYLIYIEHAAENLQFWLWYRDYSQRFDQLPPGERSLSPEWTVEQTEAEALASQNTANILPKKISPETAAVFQGSTFAVRGTGNPFNTPPRTPINESQENSILPEAGDDRDSALKSTSKSFQAQAAGAFEKADLKWQPCKATFHKDSQALIDFFFL